MSNDKEQFDIEKMVKSLSDLIRSSFPDKEGPEEKAKALYDLMRSSFSDKEGPEEKAKEKENLEGLVKALHESEEYVAVAIKKPTEKGTNIVTAVCATSDTVGKILGQLLWDHRHDKMIMVGVFQRLFTESEDNNDWKLLERIQDTSKQLLENRKSIANMIRLMDEVST